jgi:predicted phage-related endonuclease
VKKLELAIATKENKLKIALGNGEFGRSAKYNVYFKTTNRTAFNSKQFEKDYPELYEKYVKNTSYRSLRINVSKARMDD